MSFMITLTMKLVLLWSSTMLGSKSVCVLAAELGFWVVTKLAKAVCAGA
jgi:hypothetical protein